MIELQERYSGNLFEQQASSGVEVAAISAAKGV
jgi:hypothetical protein